MSNDELGTLIRNYRNTNRISQTEFGHLFDVSQPTIGYWESGKSSPSGKIREDVIKLISKKKEEILMESKHLQEIIHQQNTDIEVLKDKIRDLGGDV